MAKMLTCKCKQCLQTINFTIPEQKMNGPFPIVLIDTHGAPPHRLKAYVNKRLEIESFEIEEIQEASKVSTHILGQVLGDIGLSQQETELYFHCTSLGPVSPGEMSIIVNLPIEVVKEMARKFVEKGLFKEIAGATQYYQALPPYAALISQLDRFSGFIANIKDDTPRQLQRSFSSFEQQAKGVQNLKEFVTYLTQIKTSVAKQLADQKNTLQMSLGRLIQQRDALQQQLGSITEKISRNLEKLRLGVILQTVQDVISKIISQEAEVMQQSFSQVTIIEETLRKIFASITGQFDTTLTEASNRIQGISDTVLASFQELRNTFSENVILTLDSVLSQIIEKLHLSSTTVQEFWDEAKRVIKGTMGKDVWFIRSPEGMIAQINDAVSRAKMKVLILAPTIAHVDTISLAQAPKFINIRVAAYIDQANPRHQRIMDELAAHTNITYRHRDLQNLWGVNRDYEEVIVGVTSKDPTGGPDAVDVAAIGSILQEHIKIFVPILEDAWMGSKKDVAYTPREVPVVQTPAPAPLPITPSRGAGLPLSREVPTTRAPTLSPTPITPSRGAGLPPLREVPATRAPTLAPTPPTSLKETPVRWAKGGPGQNILKPPEPEPSAPKSPTWAPAPAAPTPVTKPVQVQPPSPSPSISGGPSRLDPEILGKLQQFADSIPTFSKANLCAQAIEELSNFIQTKLGVFHVAMTDMHNWTVQLGHGFRWDDKGKEIIRKRVSIWREKLEVP